MDKNVISITLHEQKQNTQKIKKITKATLGTTVILHMYLQDTI